MKASAPVSSSSSIVGLPIAVIVGSSLTSVTVTVNAFANTPPGPPSSAATRTL